MALRVSLMEKHHPTQLVTLSTLSFI